MLGREEVAQPAGLNGHGSAGRWQPSQPREQPSAATGLAGAACLLQPSAAQTGWRERR